MKRAKYDEVMKTATEAKSTWAIHDKLSFHYFNPNGLVSQKRELDEQIRALVDRGIVKSGAIVAYGTFDDWHYQELRALYNKKRASRWEYVQLVNGFNDRNEKAREFIKSVSAV